jgi:hypothetical protein
VFRARHPNANIVVSDVRFVDEAKMIKALGGMVILLTRSEGDSGEHTTHASEMDIDLIQPDILVENNSTLEDLRKKLNEIIPEDLGSGSDSE